jgi:nitrous oxidase accessory protein NosD
MQKRKITKDMAALGIISILLGIVLVPIVYSNHNTISSMTQSKSAVQKGTNGNILYVGGDGPHNYTNIQEAIDDASDGDIVFVYDGIYRENIRVQNAISLIGEDKNTTIINGNQEGCTINLASENTVIKNFTIIGGGFDTDDFANFFRAGIRITGSNNTICNNIFRKNRLGISGVRVTNLTIKDNSFIEDGVGFTSYENDGRPELKIKYFLHNIENNTVNGKPLYYFFNEKDKLIDNWEIGQLLLVNCTNFKIKNISISKTDWGLVCAFCNKCLTENCTFINNSLAIWTLESNNNLFQFNNISNNYHRGVVIDYNSNYNQIESNTIAKTFCGVEIEWWSNANLITKNNFLNNNVSGFEHQSLFSMWYKNYYDDWIGIKIPILFFFPKLIYGMPIERLPILTMPVSIDFFPAKEPYDI